MDPVSAFGFAVNIATLIDLSIKVVNIYRDGPESKHASLKESAGQMGELCQKLKTTDLETKPSAVGSIEYDLQGCARKCMEKAEELRKEFESTPPKGPKRLAKSMKYAFSNKFSRLEQELRNLQAELDTKLLVRIREKIDLNEVKTSEQFKLLDTSLKNWLIQFSAGNANTIDLVLDRNNGKLLDILAEIRRHQKEIEKSKDLSERKNKFLESLVYGNPFTRVNEIQNEHGGTCQWIFERSDFSSWLQTGNGIFWIQGKPGSGKSTLMKFISQSRHVERVLAQSPPTRESLVVSFYFWLADNTAMQNTEKGFLCSLLHQFLEACWEINSSYISDDQLRQKKTPGNWHSTQLKGLLLQIVPKVATKKSICVFVDGLDECQAEDLNNVIKIIKDLGKLDIKLCVSSRPEQRVINQLQSTSGLLKIEEFTKSDIRKFITDELGKVDSASSPLSHKEFSILTERLVAQANGIFLWAFIVSKDVRKGIDNEDSFAQLSERVQQIPDSVTALYEHMLDRLGPDRELYKAEAASYFSLILVSEGFRIPATGFPGPPLLGHFLPIYTDFQKGNPRSNNQNPEIVLLKVEKRITTVCAGMLDVASAMDFKYMKETGSSSWYRRVRFVHRTVRDFLLESGRGILECCKMSQFDIYRSIVDEYLKEWSHMSHNPGMNVLIVRVVRTSLKCFGLTSPTTEEAVEFLLYFDKSMERICDDKLWLYKLLLATETDIRPIYGGILDFFGATIKWGRTTALLDRALQSNVSFGRRYKAYLLLLLCECADLSPKHIRTLLAMGADLNERFYRNSRIGLTKSSPWIGYLGGCYYWTRRIDIDILQLFLDNGANLDDYRIGELKVNMSDGQILLDIQDLVYRTYNTINIVFEMNARYWLERFFGISFEDSPWSTYSPLPPAHRRVLLVFQPPAITSEADGDNEDGINDDEHWAEADSLHSERLVDPLIRSLADQTFASDGVLRQIKEDVAGLWKTGRKVNIEDYLLEKGYYRPSHDPAAMFTDYESFRREDGGIDVEALLDR